MAKPWFLRMITNGQRRCAPALAGVWVCKVSLLLSQKKWFSQKNGEMVFCFFSINYLRIKKNVRVQLTQSPLVIYSRESIHFSLLTVL